MLTSRLDAAVANYRREAGGRGAGRMLNLRRVSSHPPSDRVPLCSAVPATEAARLLSFNEYQGVLREHLAQPTLSLFAETTGVLLHLIWHRPLDVPLSGKMPVLCPRAHRRVEAGGELPIMCQRCLDLHWMPAALTGTPSRTTRRKTSLFISGGDGNSTEVRFMECGGNRFIGYCDATNFCVTLQMDDLRLVTLVLQARILCAGLGPLGVERVSRRASDHASSAGASSSPAIPEAVFRRAEALLYLFLHDVETTLDAHCLEALQHRARIRLRQLQTESNRLRRELHRRAPGFPSFAPVQHIAGSQARHIVQAMLDYVQQHYQRPMALRDVAAHLQMNANYLSDLFHKKLGVTFHHYLDNLRLAKAEELLCDPRVRVCEVAYAVGYGSPNQFRHFFKGQTGVSPVAWREDPLGGHCKASR